MATETQAVFSPEDLRKNFERLQADLNVVQNELDQALGVWRTILAAEKQEFKRLLEDREKTWDRDHAQWEKDRQAYEQKIQEFEDFFKRQLNSTEKNAVRALNELDTAWQQERLRWQQTVAQQSKESRQSQELQAASQQQLEQRVAQLTEDNAQLQAKSEQIAALETRLAEWEAEKTAWQQSLSERLNQSRQNEENWAAERQQKDALIEALQQDLATLENRLRDSETAQQIQQQNLEAYVATLESQIAALQEFLQKFLPPAHPLRRKTDRVWSGGDRVSSFSRGPH